MGILIHQLDSQLPTGQTLTAFREQIAKELENMPSPAWEARHQLGEALGAHQFRLMTPKTGRNETTVFSVIIDFMDMHGYRLMPIGGSDPRTIGTVSGLLPIGHCTLKFEELVRKLHGCFTPQEAAQIISKI